MLTPQQAGSEQKLVSEKVHMIPAQDHVGNDSGLPTIAQGVTHLKLLHAIHTLRIGVSNTDGLYGLYDNDICDAFVKSDAAPLSAANVERQQNHLLEIIKAKRWAIFVTGAAERFATWWDALKQRHGSQGLVTAQTRDKAFDDCTLPRHKRIITSKEDLPPLDVLMVWHAFMLNPQCFLEGCLRQGMMSLWHNGMPWEAVDLSIDALTGGYEPGKAAEAAFYTLTRLSWTGWEDAAEVGIVCPNSSCLAPMRVPLTTITRSEIVQWVAQTRSSGVRSPTDSGWADPAFAKICYKCGKTADHDRLRAARFVKDFFTLKEGGRDKTDFLQFMSGIILSPDGAAKSLSSKDDVRYYAHQRMRKYLKDQKPNINDITTMMQVRSITETHLKVGLGSVTMSLFLPGDRFMTKYHYSSFYLPRMLLRYYSSSSIFGLDLAAAVHRQGEFIDKMEDIGWLQSPDPVGTVESLLQKYERFFYMLSAHEAHLLVPTIDIDLAWHTHQLTPASYYAYSTKKCKGKFIDHDDKLGRAKLSQPFVQTAKIYEALFGEPYRACACVQCKEAAGAYRRVASAPSSRPLVPHTTVPTGDPEYLRLINNPFFIPTPHGAGIAHAGAHPSCGGSAGGGFGHHGGGGGGCGGGFSGGCGGGGGGGCGGGGGAGCGGGGDSGGRGGGGGDSGGGGGGGGGGGSN